MSVSSGTGSSGQSRTTGRKTIVVGACLVSSVVCLSVSLCRGLDQKLKLLLDDASHYIRPQTSLPDTSDEPFDRFADKKQITDFLQNACENCITK